ncbi:MAG: flavin reductase family protein [Ignavibacteriaceae bacterium]|nr:flavin reductase family protein [Ignavibacteriaceae bacterium]
MITFDPEKLKVPEVHRLLLGGVGPRPIALVSSVSADGIRNLSPFSFFNVFGANPPYVAFSPARRGKDASLKDTYINIAETKECVVNSVNFSMVEQISFASTEFSPEIDEFQESGLTPVESVMVRPPRVLESPFQMECRVEQILNLGDGKASGNLIICRVLLIHTNEELFEHGIISPYKIDLVARMSGEYYCRANGDSVFEIPKPAGKTGIGYKALPLDWKNSELLTANELGKLCHLESLPTIEELNSFYENLSPRMKSRSIEELNSLVISEKFEEAIPAIINSGDGSRRELLYKTAKRYLALNKIYEAAVILTIAHW